jgi:hypothetical protein
MRIPLIPAMVVATLAVAPVWAETETGQGRGTAMIRIQVIAGDEVPAATLNDTPAARDFAAMLPLELSLRDCHGTEKVADLPRQLDTTGAPASYMPKAGDITLCAPWGNLAIFYKPFRNSAGLVPLGRFDQDIAGRLKDGPARIERAAD